MHGQASDDTIEYSNVKISALAPGGLSLPACSHRTTRTTFCTDFYIGLLNYDVGCLTTHYCLHNVIIVSTLLTQLPWFCCTMYDVNCLYVCVCCTLENTYSGQNIVPINSILYHGQQFQQTLTTPTYCVLLT